jgi:glycosyltransferase involved in cell wall biosynthesis
MRPLLVDPSSRGGIAAYSALLARALEAAGAIPEILASKVLDEPADVPAVRRLPDDGWGRPVSTSVAAYPGRLLRWVRSAATVTRYVRSSRPDVVHFQAPLNRRFDPYLLRHLGRKVPIVWTAHDVLPFEMTEADRGRFAAIYRAVDRVVVHTPPASAAVMDLAGIDATVLAHPVPDTVARVSREDARRRLGLEESGRLFSAVGFIRAYKGYELLADTWEHLGAAAPSLLVMGQLSADGEAETLRRLEATGRAEIRLGYLTTEELQLAVAASDAVLLPYAVASDSGILHLARALGVPVLASDAPELAASVSATGAGRILPRTVEAWSRAVMEPLPPPPPAPPSLIETGEAHLEVYREVIAARAALRGGSFRLAVFCDSEEIAGAEVSLATLLGNLSPAIAVSIVGVDAEVVDWLAAHRPGADTAILEPVRDKRDVKGIAAYVKFFQRLRPDILQVNLRHPYSCQYAVLAGLLTAGTRVIGVEHLPVVPPANRLQLELKKLSSARLAAHVTVSRSSAGAVESLLGLPPRRVRTIYNGIAPYDGNSDTPLRLPRRSDRPLLGTIGRFVPEKGFDVFLEALGRVPEVHAVMVGDGPERPALERIVAELALADRVEFLGWRTDAQEVVRSLDALIVPSRAEALSIVSLEAMNVGVPVVASAVNGIPELVVDGVTGILVPPDDPAALAEAIAAILDPATNEAMGQKGLERVRSLFSQEGMARAYEDLYAVVLS